MYPQELWMYKCWERHDRNNNRLAVAICLLGLITGWWAVTKIMDQAFDRGYWSGRSAGWRAANEHYEKVRKLKSQSVFDYDKQN